MSLPTGTSQSSARNSDDGGRRFYGSPNARAGADEGTVPNPERRLRRSVNHYCSGSDENACTNMYPTGDVDTRGQSREIAQDCVMANRTIQIDVNVPTDPDVGSNDAACADDTSVSDFNPFGHFDTRVDERRGTKPGLLCSSDHFSAGRWVADCGDDLRFRMPKARFL